MNTQHALSNMRKLIDAQHFIALALLRARAKKVDEANKFMESAAKEMTLVWEALASDTGALTAPVSMLKMFHEDLTKQYAKANLEVGVNEKAKKALTRA